MLDHEIKVGQVKLAGGGILSAATVLTLNEWVAVLTIIYMVLQIVLLLPKYYTIYLAWREKRRKRK